MQYKNLASQGGGPIEVQWEATSSDDLTETFTVYDRGTENPVDISEWTFGGVVATSRNSEERAADITFSFGSDGTDGQVTYSLTNPATTPMPRGEYWYQLTILTPQRKAFQAGVLVLGFDHLGAE